MLLQNIKFKKATAMEDPSLAKGSPHNPARQLSFTEFLELLVRIAAGRQHACAVHVHLEALRVGVEDGDDHTRAALLRQALLAAARWHHQAQLPRHQTGRERRDGA